MHSRPRLSIFGAAGSEARHHVISRKLLDYSPGLSNRILLPWSVDPLKYSFPSFFCVLWIVHHTPTYFDTSHQMTFATPFSPRALLLLLIDTRFPYTVARWKICYVKPSQCIDRFHTCMESPSCQIHPISQDVKARYGSQARSRS